MSTIKICDICRKELFKTQYKEEIQVGDEVEHKYEGWRGIVHNIGDGYLCIFRLDAGFGFRSDAYNEEFFTRTGKTCPELIKDLDVCRKRLKDLLYKGSEDE